MKKTLKIISLLILIVLFISLFSILSLAKDKELVNSDFKKIESKDSPVQSTVLKSTFDSISSKRSERYKSSSMDEIEEATVIEEFSDRLTLGWTVNPADYLFTGSLATAVFIGGERATNEGDILVAFVDGEVRGVAEATYFSLVDDYFFLLTVYSNEPSGEIMNFKYYDSEIEEIKDLETELDFESNLILGNGVHPYELYIDSTPPSLLITSQQVIEEGLVVSFLFIETDSSFNYDLLFKHPFSNDFTENFFEQNLIIECNVYGCAGGVLIEPIYGSGEYSFRVSIENEGGLISSETIVASLNSTIEGPCHDTDNTQFYGIDYYKKGLTLDFNEHFEIIDYCVDEMILREGFCYQGSYGQQDYGCLGGCSNGECIPFEE
mgnify:CR=1 FL=1